MRSREGAVLQSLTGKGELGLARTINLGRHSAGPKTQIEAESRKPTGFRLRQDAPGPIQEDDAWVDLLRDAPAKLSAVTKLCPG